MGVVSVGNEGDGLKSIADEEDSFYFGGCCADVADGVRYKGFFFESYR